MTWEPLPSVTATPRATESGAPRVWDDIADNVYVRLQTGDKTSADAAFAQAKQVVKLETWVPQI